MQPYNSQYDNRNDQDNQSRTSWGSKEPRTERHDRDDRWDAQSDHEPDSYGDRRTRPDDAGGQTRDRERPMAPRDSDREHSGYRGLRDDLEGEGTRSQNRSYYGDEYGSDRIRSEQERGWGPNTGRGARYAEHEYGVSPYNRNEQDRQTNYRSDQQYGNSQRYRSQEYGDSQPYRSPRQYSGQRGANQDMHFGGATQPQDIQAYGGQSGINAGHQRNDIGSEREFRPSGRSNAGGQATSFRGYGPQGYTRSDERVIEDIHERLTDDHQVDGRHIDVRVSKGAVTLTGRVSERAMKYRAEEIAERVSGVKEVDNQIKVAKADDKKADDKKADDKDRDKQDQTSGEHKGRSGSSNTGATTNKPNS